MHQSETRAINSVYKSSGHDLAINWKGDFEVPVSFTVASSIKRLPGGCSWVACFLLTFEQFFNT